MIYNFTCSNHGGFPQGGVTLGTSGDFYGTTFELGTGGAETVFKVTSSGALTTLYNFTGGSDGGPPTRHPLKEAMGTSTAQPLEEAQGPVVARRMRTIYKITPPGTFGVLHPWSVSDVSFASRSSGSGHRRQLLRYNPVRDQLQLWDSI